jgi:hypothetical protein
MKFLRIVNWNAQADQQTGSNGRAECILTLLDQFDADVICLTEAYPTNVPKDGHYSKHNLWLGMAGGKWRA